MKPHPVQTTASQQGKGSAGTGDLQTFLSNLPRVAYRSQNDRGRRMLFIGPESLPLCGYSAEELTRARPRWSDLVHPDDQNRVRHTKQCSLDQGEAFETQYRIRCRNGQEKWVWERGIGVDDDEQGAVVVGTITDLSTLRERELQRERSEAFAHAIVDGVAEGIVVVDVSGHIESANSAAQRILGREIPELVGLSIRELVSPADLAMVNAEMKAHSDTGTSRLLDGGCELNAIRIDGTEIPVYISAQEMQTSSGQSYSVLFRDVSPEKARDEKIRQQNERLNAILEYSPIGIAMADKSLRIVAANPAYGKMLGYDASELIGRSFSDFTHPDDIEMSEQIATSSLTGGPDHYVVRKRYVHKDGHTVDVQLNVAMVHDSSGDPAFAVANVEDLTARVRTERLVKEQQEQLARLERLSMLGEMMAGIAHEINQPLTAISTYAQSGLRFLNADSPKPERLRSALEKLSEQARRAGAVVERIRDMSRQTSGRSERLDCNRLIESIEELAATDAHARGVRLLLELSPQRLPVSCDVIQIQQVILNLVRNAVDAMVAVDMRYGDEVLLRTSIAGDIVRIDVKDSGEGVSEEVGREMFRPFSTNKPAGLGLGLSISRTIVTAHGGQLDFENNPDHGATFSVTLPKAPGDIDHE